MPTNDATTRLLLHFDGPVGSKSIYDDSAGGNPKSLVCNGVISDAQAKIGGRSLYCYGMENNVTVGPSMDFNFGSGPFTVEGWFYPLAPFPYLFCFWANKDNWFGLEHCYTDALGGQPELHTYYRLRLVIGGRAIAEGDLIPWPSHHFVVGEWVHVAIARKNQYVTVYLNGQFDGDPLLPSASYPLNFGTWPLYLGRGPRYGRPELGHLHGWVDEFRVSASHTIASSPLAGGGGFTAPTTPYQNSFEACGGGVFNVRAPVEARLSQKFGVQYFPVEACGGGSYNVRAGVEQRGSGVHQVRAPIEQQGAGRYSVAQTSTPQRYRVEASGRGVFQVRRPVETAAGGKYNVHGETFEASGGGQYHVRAAIEESGAGQFRVRGCIEAVGSGKFKTEWDGNTYELFVGVNQSPDYDAAPTQTYSSLPIVYTLPAAAGIYYVAVRVRNKYGLTEYNLDEHVYELNASLEFVTPIPQAPFDIALEPGASGSVIVRALYLQAEDPYPAVKWYVYSTIGGADPDPELDTPEQVTMRVPGGMARLEHTVTGASQGQTVKAIVRVARSSDGRESDNTGIVSTQANLAGPTGLTLRAFHRVGAAVAEAGE